MRADPVQGQGLHRGVIESDIEGAIQQGRSHRAAIAGKAFLARPDRRRDYIFRHAMLPNRAVKIGLRPDIHHRDTEDFGHAGAAGLQPYKCSCL